MKSAYAIAILSIFGGLFIHLMVLLVIHIETPLIRPLDEASHQVKYIGSLTQDAVPAVIEQAVLNDSAPLFMPTHWNPVSDMSNVASLQSATEIFEPFSPLLLIVDARPTAPLNRAEQIATRELRLPSGPAFMLSRFGRKQMRIPNHQSEGASFIVKRLDLPVTTTLPEQSIPADVRLNAPESMWNPVRLFLQLEGGVPIGLPLIAQSSGFAGWDTSLQAYFTQLGFYRKLNDGYYQIWVYP